MTKKQKNDKTGKVPPNQKGPCPSLTLSCTRGDRLNHEPAGSYYGLHTFPAHFKALPTLSIHCNQQENPPGAPDCDPCWVHTVFQEAPILPILTPLSAGPSRAQGTPCSQPAPSTRSVCASPPITFWDPSLKTYQDVVWEKVVETEGRMEEDKGGRKDTFLKHSPNSFLKWSLLCPVLQRRKLTSRELK